MLKTELKPWFKSGNVEAGCDEAGRGCLAGPVFAAAVILPPDFYDPDLNDSKQIPMKMRYHLREVIQKEALAWSVAQVANEEIDKINILNASIKAMHLAIGQLNITPGFLIIDGNRFWPYPGISHKTVVKGDGLYFSIAAASILAKTYRDDFMNQIHEEFPKYGWKKNKGYPTAEHRKAIAIYGISRYHRKSFNLIDDQLRFDF